MPKLKPGDKAPDFTLPSTDGSQFTLSDYWQEGPAVLVFYRGDFCPACNLYLHSLQESVGRFTEAGARIVAISSDRAEVERQTVQRHQLAFPVLSDPQHQAVDAYDVVYNEREGHAEPAAFVITQEGAVAYESIVSGPLGRPSPDDLLKIVQGAKRQRKAA
ncbi:MAG: AhpC/TSA family protein [Chloroflexi bacterium]|nr:AhpC/TSA family protein [Chloroflexota bacterium]